MFGDWLKVGLCESVCQLDWSNYREESDWSPDSLIVQEKLLPGVKKKENNFQEFLKVAFGVFYFFKKGPNLFLYLLIF